MLRGKTCWLIGASEGIGRALALGLAREGVTLALSARQADKLAQLQSELKGSGHLSVPVDASDASAVANAYGQIKTQIGVPDMVIYNAGIYEPMPIAAWDLPTIERTMSVNLMGAFYTVDALRADFLARHSGRLVMVSSVAAYRGLPKSMAYGASKAALTNLTESLRIELQPHGITVQLVSPGFVKTRLTAKNNFPMPFAVTPEEAATRIVNGIARDVYEIHFPRRFSFFMKLLRILPNRLFFFLANKL